MLKCFFLIIQGDFVPQHILTLLQLFCSISCFLRKLRMSGIFILIIFIYKTYILCFCPCQGHQGHRLKTYIIKTYLKTTETQTKKHNSNRDTLETDLESTTGPECISMGSHGNPSDNMHSTSALPVELSPG